MSLQVKDRDNGYAALFDRVRRAKNRVGAASSSSPSHRISIGIHGEEAKIAYDGSTEEVTVVEVAAAHEYGLGVPERSFIRSWFDENRPRLARELKFAQRAELMGTNPDAVVQLAQRWRSEVVTGITSRSAHLTPLAESTIKARERAGISQETPLDATGQLVASIRAMVDGEYV